MFIYATLHLYVPSVVFPRARRQWWMASVSKCHLQFHCPCLELSVILNQQAFQELMPAVFSSQWPRNTSEQLCITKIPEVLLSLEVKIPSLLYEHPRLAVLHLPGFMPFLLLSSPCNDKLAMAGWLQTYQVSPSESWGLYCAFVQGMKKAHWFIGAERKEQLKLHCQMISFP